jgi:DNA-binding response OmpR family regulator
MNELIVLIDDDPAWVQILSELLRRWGYVVRAAQTRRDGERLVQTAAPRLILLDVHLRQDDGLDLLRELRRGGRMTPVLLISADDTLDPQAVLAWGANDFITKPFSPAQLRNAVHRLLSPAASGPRRPGTGPPWAIPAWLPFEA